MRNQVRMTTMWTKKKKLRTYELREPRNIIQKDQWTSENKTWRMNGFLLVQNHHLALCEVTEQPLFPLHSAGLHGFNLWLTILYYLRTVPYMWHDAWKPERFTASQRLGKHISAEANEFNNWGTRLYQWIGTHTTIRWLLETVFFEVHPEAV